MLILCFVLRAAVNAKLNINTNENLTAEGKATAALYQVTSYSDLNNSISEVDFKLHNSLYISRLLFETVKSPYLFLTFIPSAEINNDYGRNSFNLLTHLTQRV